MLNLQTRYHLKLDFQRADQHTGSKWLIHNMWRNVKAKVSDVEMSKNLWIVQGNLVLS